MNKPRILKYSMWSLIIPILILCVLLVGLRYYQSQLIQIEKDKALSSSIIKPNIVEVNTCLEGCPLDPSVYKVKVYEGVTDSKLCGDLGGQYRVIYSNVEMRICVVL
jgi:hypothetical protein